MKLRPSRLPFQVEMVNSPGTVTGHAGLAVVIEAFRGLGLPKAIERHLRLKQRRRGYAESALIETLVALLAAGGE